MDNTGSLKAKFDLQYRYRYPTCDVNVRKAKIKVPVAVNTCSPVDRERKETDIKAVPGPEESHSATKGREELQNKR
jgi:hypothetical protein